MAAGSGQEDRGHGGRETPKRASKGGWMPPISFNSVLIIAGISVFVPVVLGLLPRLPVPGAVLEVIAGVVVGPSVLGWARIDAPVQVLSTLGLGMLLFLAGLETGKITPTTAAALVAAGLLSAALFPAGAERLLAPRS